MKRDLMGSTETPAKTTLGPADYDPGVASEVLARIAAGASLAAIARDPRMPKRRTFHKWLDADEALRSRWRLALRLRAEALADQVVDLADAAVDVPKARLQTDNRKWLAGRLDPAKWGDKQTVELDVAPAVMPMLEVARRLAFMLDKAEREREMVTVDQEPALPPPEA